ncbi:TonB family protein, partial [candidate division WOR-3 bacterium]|nr:TonB family protein [candidate division WOR-3 bacterium]
MLDSMRTASRLAIAVLCLVAAAAANPERVIQERRPARRWSLFRKRAPRFVPKPEWALEYPKEALRARTEGGVVVRVIKSERGTRDSAWVRRSSGNALLDSAALAAAIVHGVNRNECKDFAFEFRVYKSSKGRDSAVARMAHAAPVSIRRRP